MRPRRKPIAGLIQGDRKTCAIILDCGNKLGIDEAPTCLMIRPTGDRLSLLSANDEGIARIERLYAEVFACTTCIGVTGCQITADPDRVRRRVLARALNSKVFVIGQALSKNSQRKSGLPYVLANGRLSQTGRKLDAFLGSFGYTIDPNSERWYAYSSDLIQHYPGKDKDGDRRPTIAERDNCSAWLRRELELVRPKVVILLGELPSRDFLSRYGLDRSCLAKVPWGCSFECDIAGWEFAAFVMPHFSYRFRANFVEAVRLETAQRIWHHLYSI